MRRILVTGGAGFIGANLVRALSARGWFVRVADNLSHGTVRNLYDPEGHAHVQEFLACDLREMSSARTAVEGMDVVVHLAGIVAGIDYVLAHQAHVFRSNMLLNSNVVTACANANIQHFVYMGSACSYPPREDSRELFREPDAFPAHPHTAFGWSRLMGEYETQLLATERALPYTILRLHNVYGPYADLSETRAQVVPALVRKALLARNHQLEVWGDGTQTRDFVFVNDVIDAVVRTLDRGPQNTVIQLATGTHTSLREMAFAVAQAVDTKLEPSFDTTRPTGDTARAGNPERAQTHLQWQAETPLTQGISRTVDWARTVLSSSERLHSLTSTASPVDVVMPVHNEAASIESVVTEFYQAIQDVTTPRFLLCEDGSTDDTLARSRALAHVLPVEVVSAPQRKGYARAMLDGLSLANTPWIVAVDSDGQMDPAYFQALWTHRTDADVVIGIREQRNDPLLRRVLSLGFKQFYEHLFRTDIQDPSCPFVLMTREARDQLVPRLGSMEVGFWWEFIAVARHLRLRIHQVPVRHRMRTAGQSRAIATHRIPGIALTHTLALLRLQRTLSKAP